MKYFTQHTLFGLALYWLLSIASFSNAFELSDSESIVLDKGQLSILRDSDGTLNLSDVQTAYQQQHFTPLSGNFTQGYVKDVFWIRTEVNVIKSTPVQRWLEVMPSYLDNIRLFHVSSSSEVGQHQGGDFVPQSLKAEDYRGTLFKLDLPPGKHELYIRIDSTSTMVAEITLWQPEAFINYSRKSYLAYGLYFSLILGIFLFNLTTWVVSRKAIFIVYSGYLLLNSVQWLSINGFASEFLFPENPLMANLTLAVALPLSTAMAFLFFTILFELRRYHPLIFKINMTGILIGVLTAISIPIGHHQLFAQFMLPIVLLSISTSYWPLSRLWQSKILYKRLLVVAHICFLVLVGINILSTITVIPFSISTIYAGMASNLTHILITYVGLMLYLRKTESEHLIAIERSNLHKKEATIEKRYNKQQKELLSILTHEIRTPIAVIDAANTSLQIMNKKDDINPIDRERRYDRIRRASVRLNMALEIGLMQINREGLPFHPELWDFRSLTTDVIGLVDLDDQGRILFNRDNQPLEAFVDKRLMVIAMLNILDNAIKYSPGDSEIQVTCQFSVKNNTKGIVWSVLDHGPGVSPVEIESIFQKPFRGSDVNNISGLGLGLYLSKKIVTRHQGEISIKNRANQGAIFSFWVPLERST